MVLMVTGSEDPLEASYRETQEGFWRLRLVTEVRPDGVHIRFEPLQRSFRSIPFDEIDEITRERYSAVNYGGWHWGIRVGPTGDNTVYRISGDDGVQLRLIDGRRIFIGSRRPEKLKDAIITARENE